MPTKLDIGPSVNSPHYNSDDRTIDIAVGFVMHICFNLGNRRTINLISSRR